MKSVILLFATLAILGACSNSPGDKQIHTDEDLPLSPCACDPIIPTRPGSFGEV